MRKGLDSAMPKLRPKLRRTTVAFLCACSFALPIASPALGAPKVGGSDMISVSETSLLQNRSKDMALSPINLDVSRFAFTAPGKTAPAKPATKAPAVERSFAFTPSGNAAKGVSIAAAARGGTPQRLSPAPVELITTPQPYDLDLSVAYRGFALSGGIRQNEADVTGGRQTGVDLGLSYGARNWRTSVQASADPAPRVITSPAQAQSDRLAVEAGGALLLSPSLSVGGGVRYRVAPTHPTPLDSDKDDRAVFIGGKLAF